MGREPGRAPRLRAAPRNPLPVSGLGTGEESRRGGRQQRGASPGDCPVGPRGGRELRPLPRRRPGMERCRAPDGEKINSSCCGVAGFSPLPERAEGSAAGHTAQGAAAPAGCQPCGTASGLADWQPPSIFGADPDSLRIFLGFFASPYPSWRESCGWAGRDFCLAQRWEAVARVRVSELPHLLLRWAFLAAHDAAS